MARLKSKRESSSEPAAATVKYLGVGIDTARYGHHVTFLRDDKQPAAPALTVTENREGYESLQQRLADLRNKYFDAHIYVRIDAAGQYATNLERFLRSLADIPMSISIGEPKRNKDYHRAHSPKQKSDQTESYAMARYAVVERPQPSHGKPADFAVLQQIAARLEAQTKQSTRLVNQLHVQLSNSFPELARVINDVSVGWVLKLLELYPTAEKLARAKLSSIQAIPRIPVEMPAKLLQLAKTSVGTLDGPLAELMLVELVQELQSSKAQELRWRELLNEAYEKLPDGAHQQVVTIQGIGPQTAAAIVATAVDIERFEDEDKFVGYYGVFPSQLQSGVDKFGQPMPAGKKIMCPKGNDLVRRLLWQCAKCASNANGGNPAVRELYLRRLEKGDCPQVACGYCMTKLLRQVYGVWKTNTQFDPQHDAKIKAEKLRRANAENNSVASSNDTELPPVASETQASLTPSEPSETAAVNESVAVEPEPEAEESGRKVIVTEPQAPFGRRTAFITRTE